MTGAGDTGAQGDIRPAPFYADLAGTGPEAEAWWVTAPDGVRLRIARLGRGPKGTVLMLPGRTEYIEKYGPAAQDLAARGYGAVTLDWRGQGLADRLLADPAKGHVARFGDYQHDLQALTQSLPAMGMEGPFFMLAHSMGGAIGLRGLLGEHQMRAVAFTGPMWGIWLSSGVRPFARAITGLAEMLGLSHRFAPGTGPLGYTQRAPFEGNTLTTDPEMFAWMKAHLEARPALSLGGPTLHWLDEALREMKALMAASAPALPCLTVVGEAEAIVDVPAVRDRMTRWPGGQLQVMPGAQHEVIMETPARRAHFFDAAAALFDAELSKTP